MHDNWETFGNVFWTLAPIILPIITYLIGLAKDKWHLPKPIAQLLADKEVMALVANGIKCAAVLVEKSDAERQAYAREWLKRELQLLLGKFVPDSAINFLIEKVIVDRKEATG